MGGCVAIVARKSTKDEQKVSTLRQEKLGRVWARRELPDRPVRVYSDNAVSGVVMDRPGWRAFCDDVRAGHVEAVWAYEQSRLTRAGSDTWDQVAVMLEKAKIREIHTQTQGVISVEAGSRLYGRMLALIDQEEVERARVRATDAHANLASEGRPAGGKLYGYDRAVDERGRKCMLINEGEARITREIAQRLLAGESQTGIAKDLNRRRVPTARQKGPWTSTHIRAIVTKHAVAGLRVHQPRDMAGTTVGDPQVQTGTWPAILNLETWERLRNLLNGAAVVVGTDGRQKRVTRTRRTPRRYLLTGGIAVCGVCGHDLIAQRRDGPRHEGKQAAYTCHPTKGGCSRISIGAEAMEMFVSQAVLQALRDPALARALDPAPDDRRGTVARHILNLQMRASELTEMFVAGEIDAPQLRTGTAEVKARVAQLRRELDRLPPTDVDLPAPALVANSWDSLALEQRQAVIRRLLESVAVMPAKPGTRAFDPDRVVPTWRDRPVTRRPGRARPNRTAP